MKKIKILVTIGIVLGTVLICGCVQEGKIEPPTLEVIDIDILELSVDETTLNMTVVIHNPNSVGGTFNRISYTVYFKDERPLVGSDEYEFLGYSVDEKKVTIETGDTTMYSFLTVSNREVLQTLVTLSVQGHVWIKVEGTADSEIKSNSYSMPFEKEILVML